MKMTTRAGPRLAAGMVILLGCLAAARAQEARPADEPSDVSVVYLRPPESRLSRLEQFLELTKSQKAKVLRILRKADASVRAAVDKGNDDIRRVLNEEQQAQFDELKPDTEISPDTQTRAAMRLPPLQNQQGGGGRGGQRGGQGQGGQGMGGQGMGGGGCGGQGGGQRGSCGDGICQQIERTRGLCPQDCGQSQD